MELLNITSVVYLISNMFRMYIVYRFLRIFFKKRDLKNIYYIWGYTLYFLVNSFLFVFLNNPLINLLNNILLLFFLTYLYKGSVKKRILVTIFNIALSIAVEGIVHFTALKLNVLKEDIYILDAVVSHIVLFIIVLLIEKKLNSLKNYEIQSDYFLSLLLIPFGSIILLVNIILSNQYISDYKMILNIVIVFIINFLVFYLYDDIIKSYNQAYHNKILRQQNNSYKNQFEIIKKNSHNIKMIRHDFLNHMSAIYILARNKEFKKINEYIKSIEKQLENHEEIVNTGNNEIDAILNYKFAQAKKENVELDYDVNIAEDFQLVYFDLNVILGNLLDNALEAVRKVKKKRLRVEIKNERGALYIKILNTFNGNIYKFNDELHTIKDNSELHGIGLHNVQEKVKQYNGELFINYNKNEFIVEVLLFN